MLSRVDCSQINIPFKDMLYFTVTNILLKIVLTFIQSVDGKICLDITNTKYLHCTVL